MTEGEEWKVDAQEERVGRVWGWGAWRDVLPTVCHFLPPRDRFFVQRTSKLFQRASEKARLAVGELELNAVNEEYNGLTDLKFTAKILDSTASAGIISLRVPHLLQRFHCCHGDVCRKKLSISERETQLFRLEESRRKFEEKLAKLSLPSLTHVSLSTEPLAQAVLRRHLTVSSVELSLGFPYCFNACDQLLRFRDTERKMTEMILEALPGGTIRKLIIHQPRAGTGVLGFLSRPNCLEYLEEFTVIGVEQTFVHLPVASPRLRTVNLEMKPNRLDKPLNLITFLANRKEFAQLRHMTITHWTPHSGGEQLAALTLPGLSLESLHIGFELHKEGREPVVRNFIESVASGGELSNLTWSLQELTVSINYKCEKVDMSVFDTDAFLRFPRLHSLRLRIDRPHGPQLQWYVLETAAYEQLPAFAELNRRLRLLEIPLAFLPPLDPTADIREFFHSRVLHFLHSAVSPNGGVVERTFKWLPVCWGQHDELNFLLPSEPRTVEYTKGTDREWIAKEF